MKAELVSTIEKLFQKFDTSNVGSIGYLELKAQLTRMGVNITLIKAKEIIAKADKSKTGKLNYVDFEALMLPVVIQKVFA